MCALIIDSDDDNSSLALGSLFGMDVDRASTEVEPPPTTLYLVRASALRIHDNKAFATAISDKTRRFRAVFIMDTWYTCAEGRLKIGLNRSVFGKCCTV